MRKSDIGTGAALQGRALRVNQAAARLQDHLNINIVARERIDEQSGPAAAGVAVGRPKRDLVVLRCGRARHESEQQYRD